MDPALDMGGLFSLLKWSSDLGILGFRQPTHCGQGSDRGRFPSGQRGQTVNLLATPSKVRILLSPGAFFRYGRRLFLFPRAVLRGEECFNEQ
jgi:hypothetical protein